jgi:hypothetical protein
MCAISWPQVWYSSVTLSTSSATRTHHLGITRSHAYIRPMRKTSYSRTTFLESLDVFRQMWNQRQKLLAQWTLLHSQQLLIIHRSGGPTKLYLAIFWILFFSLSLRTQTLQHVCDALTCTGAGRLGQQPDNNCCRLNANNHCFCLQHHNAQYNT